MKVKVLHEFVDRYTRVAYNVGDILDINENRFDEIQKVGLLVEKVNEEIETEKPTKTKKN